MDRDRAHRIIDLQDAIYELNGDTLRICYDLSGSKRPTEFKTAAGTKLYLVTYNRKKE